MTYERTQPGRGAEAEITATLMEWEPAHSFSGQLHVGDVGWYLRMGDLVVDRGLHVWRGSDDEIAAVGLQHGAGVLLTAVSPWLRHDLDLGQQMAADVRTILSGDDCYVDAPQPSAVRIALATAGWDLDPDPWPVFYRPLNAADRDRVDHDMTIVLDDLLARDRLQLQQVLFKSTQSDADSWNRMRDLTSYRADLDVMIRHHGQYVAAATAWWAGDNKCGLLEPVGTHPEHRGQGHGRRVVLAALTALARSGASGAAVFTPESNVGAVELYRSCGFRALGLAASMRSPQTALRGRAAADS